MANHRKIREEEERKETLSHNEAFQTEDTDVERGRAHFGLLYLEAVLHHISLSLLFYLLGLDNDRGSRGGSGPHSDLGA